MQNRVLTALGASILLALSTTAHAAAERGCQVLTDPAGDAHAEGLAPAAAPAELDLRSARIGIDHRALTVTIRVTRAEAAMTTAGESWQLVMSDAERTIDLDATRGPDGVAFAAYGGYNGADTAYSSNQPYLGPISGRLDLPSGLLVMTAPLHQLGVRPSSVFTHFGMSSGQGAATSGSATEGTPLSPAGPSLDQSTTTPVDHAERDVRLHLDQRC